MRGVVWIGIAVAFGGSAVGACSSFDADTPPPPPGNDGGTSPEAGAAGGVDASSSPADIVALYAGNSAGCALRRDHRLACWGRNDVEQLGLPSAANDGCPAAGCRTQGVEVTGAGEVEQLSIGDTSMCAVRTDGSVACWGSNDDGRLGFTGEGGATARVVAGLPGKALQVEVGADNACARVDTSGGVQVWCWGGNLHGINGRPIPKDGDALPAPSGPTHIEDLDGAKQIDLTPTKPALACALMGDASVRCWGLSYKGGTGADPASDAVCDSTFKFTCTEKRNVIQGAQAEAIGVGWGFACGLAGGKVSCWGDNEHGVFNGAPDDKVHVGPTPVTGVPFVNALAVGEDHVCVLASGDIWCWGSNTSGEQGTVRTTGGCAGNVFVTQSCQAKPTKVALPNVTLLAAGAYFTTAVADGKVYAWGLNEDGRAGHPPRTQGDADSPCGVGLYSCNPMPLEVKMPW